MNLEPPDESTLARRMEEVEVLRELEPGQREQLARKGQFLIFAAGEDLIRAGEQSDYILVVLEGEVLVLRAEQPEAEALRLRAPLLTGEIAAYAGRPRNATVRACGEVSALRVERADFLDAVRHAVAAGQALTGLVARRIRDPGSIKTLGRYRVDELAGQGGSGYVFRAYDEGGSRVALKMLSHALALIPGATATFRHEAEMLTRLDHPSIIRLLETFEEFDTCFIAMPWIDGQSLRARIDAGERFTSGDIAAWTRQLLEALEVMHRAGIAHCDIKPSNILIDENRRAVLIDLGAGCFLGDERRDQRQFCGSPLYTSPEQIMGRKPDGRSDIYALCCTLYELIYGEPPFTGETIDDIMNAHLRMTPSFHPDKQIIPVDDTYLIWLRRGLKRARTGRPDAQASRGLLGVTTAPQPPA
ncbi:MAG: protein kinase domain-containing protein [Kiritimatiellia bacterium]